ncbi:uncharacterized protein LOC135928401 isoform X2 [Gordionus sp. m RMFG-2023]
MAASLNEKVGQTAGYQIRLESKVSPTTILTYCTPWVFLRNLISSDPELSRITHIIIDDINDRVKCVDLILIYMKLCFLPKHKNIKLLLNTGPSSHLENLIAQYFNLANISTHIVKIAPRDQAKVDVLEYYLEDTLKYVGILNEEAASFEKSWIPRTMAIERLKQFLAIPCDTQLDPVVIEYLANTIPRLNEHLANNSNGGQESIELDKYIDKSLEEVWLLEWLILHYHNDVSNTDPRPDSNLSILKTNYGSSGDYYKNGQVIMRGKYMEALIDLLPHYGIDVINQCHTSLDCNAFMLSAALGLNHCLTKIFFHLNLSNPNINNNKLGDTSTFNDGMCGINRFCKLNGWTALHWAKHFNRTHSVALINTFYQIAGISPFEETRLLLDTATAINASGNTNGENNPEITSSTLKAKEIPYKDQNILLNQLSLLFYEKCFASRNRDQLRIYQDVLIALLLKLVLNQDMAQNSNLAGKGEGDATKINEARHILLFLPTFDDISRFKDVILTHDLFSRLISDHIVRIFVMYADMHPTDLKQIYSAAKSNYIKIILSTEIGETILPLNDISYVIDTGLVEKEIFEPSTNSSSHKLCWISKQNVEYRKNIVKRRESYSSSPAYFAVYSSTRYKQYMPSHVKCKFSQGDLSDILIQAKHLIPVNSSLQDFLCKAPEPCSSVNPIRVMIQNLKNIDVLDDCLDLTELGQHSLDIPLHPKWAKMIIHALVLKCLDPVLTVVSSLAASHSPYLPRYRLIVGKEAGTLVDDCDKLNSSNESEILRNKLLALRSEKASFSDHMVLIRIFQNWQKARLEGREPQFCAYNNLSPVNLERIFTLRSHILGQLRACGLIKSNQLQAMNQQDALRSFNNNSNSSTSSSIGLTSNPNSSSAGFLNNNNVGNINNNGNNKVIFTGSFGDIRDCNSNSEHWAVVKACLAMGLYPNICKLTTRAQNNKQSKESGEDNLDNVMFLSSPINCFFNNQASSVNKDANSNRGASLDSTALSGTSGNSTTSNTVPDLRVRFVPGTSFANSNFRLPSEWIVFDHYFPLSTPQQPTLNAINKGESNATDKDNDNRGKENIDEKKGLKRNVCDNGFDRATLTDRSENLQLGGYIGGCSVISPVVIALFVGPNRTPKDYVQDIENPDSLQNMANLILQDESDSENESDGNLDYSPTSSELNNSLFGNAFNIETNSLSNISSSSHKGKRSSSANKIDLKLDDRIVFQHEVEVIRQILHLRQKYHALTLRRLKHPSKPWTNTDETILKTIVSVVNQEESFLGFSQPSGIGQRPKPMPTEFNNNNNMIINTNITKNTQSSLQYNEPREANCKPITTYQRKETGALKHSPFQANDYSHSLSISSLKFALLKIYTEEGLDFPSTAPCITGTNLRNIHEEMNSDILSAGTINSSNSNPHKMGKPEDFCNYPQVEKDVKNVIINHGSFMIRNGNVSDKDGQEALLFVFNRQTNIFMGLVKVKISGLNIKANIIDPAQIHSNMEGNDGNLVRIDGMEWVIKKLVDIKRINLTSPVIFNNLLENLLRSSMKIIELDVQFVTYLFKYFDNISTTY